MHVLPSDKTLSPLNLIDPGRIVRGQSHQENVAPYRTALWRRTDVDVSWDFLPSLKCLTQNGGVVRQSTSCVFSERGDSVRQPHEGGSVRRSSLPFRNS